MPGPAPKDPASRRRRNAAVGKTLLPAEGRTGKTPRWPLAVTKPTALWTSLWKQPQAVAWERYGLTRVVARYAVLLQHAEDISYGEEGEPQLPSASLLGEVRQLEDRLGLNPKAMRSLLCEVATDELAEQRAAAPATTGQAKRAALRVV